MNGRIKSLCTAHTHMHTNSKWNWSKLVGNKVANLAIEFDLLHSLQTTLYSRHYMCSNVHAINLVSCCGVVPSSLEMHDLYLYVQTTTITKQQAAHAHTQTQTGISWINFSFADFVSVYL